MYSKITKVPCSLLTNICACVSSNLMIHIDHICRYKRGMLFVDFANTRDDILKVFQPYYVENDIVNPIGADRIYGLLDEVYSYHVRTSNVVDCWQD